MANFKLCMVLLVLQVYVRLTVQDIFMTSPRGSNNRLNEKGANRANNNRLFNSQNNNRGGYNVGDRYSVPAPNADEQYHMRYLQSGLKGDSELIIEWTHQHGCGDKSDANCNLVIQYMCDDSKDENDRLRDGFKTNSQQYTKMGNDTKTAHAARKQANVVQNRGLHETWQYYDRCRYRQRNYNLFTADRNLQKNEKGYSSASYTRQNNNGARSGYECQEERDYYPYWHPNPWKDIAILTSDVSLCEKVYRGNSFNVKPLHECVEFYKNGEQKHWSRWNNQKDCEKNNGQWTEFYNYLEKAPQLKNQKSCEDKTTQNIRYKWAVPQGSDNVNQKECLVLLKAPECKKAPETRANHLGNTMGGNSAGRYIWKLPYFPSQTTQECIVRMRYNISTNDYDGFGIDSKANQNGRLKIESPVRNNPRINFGNVGATKTGANKEIKLRMAINTAQFGRTFQDRAHSFYLLPRGGDVPDTAKVHNLNVRGRRGNIVQVFPAVEYDFIPNDLTVKKNEYVHIQWTGSNTSPNGAGQGKANTDRSNFVQISESKVNYPVPFQQAISGMWQDVQTAGMFDFRRIKTGEKRNTYLRSKTSAAKDLALYFATAGYYRCYEASTCGDLSVEKKNVLDQEMNNGFASFPGALVKFTKPNKTYYYMSSRNNAFTNREQKGRINVVA